MVRNAQARIRSISSGYHGQLRIALTDALAQPQITQLLMRYREEEPGTEILLFEMTVNAMQQAFLLEQIDVGFTLDDGTATSNYTKFAVWKERLAVAIPARHPLLAFERIPVSEIRRAPLIFWHPEQCCGGYNTCQHLLVKGEAAPFPLNIVGYASGHEAMMMQVAAGYGIGIGLESQLALYDNPTIIVRPLDDDLFITTFIVISKAASPELKRFIDRAQQIGMLA